MLGLGLIGGSVLRAAAAAGRPVWGATASATDSAAATADGFEVLDTRKALERAAESDALVVLAVPLPAVPEVLRAVDDAAPECRLTDVTSVKRPVTEAVQRYAPRARFVGGHPMAGTSVSGWAAGSAELFRGAAWVVSSEDGTDLEVWSDAVALALDCGAHVVPAGDADHDDAVARISHLPHLLAAVLAAVGADGGRLALSLAAGSFTDGTRVAGSRPELVRAMCEGNRDALLPALDDALGKLGAARGALASTGSLNATITTGHRARADLTTLRTAAGQPRTAPMDMPVLRMLASQGFRITGLTPGEVTGTLPA